MGHHGPDLITVTDQAGAGSIVTVELTTHTPASNHRPRCHGLTLTHPDTPHSRGGDG